MRHCFVINSIKKEHCWNFPHPMWFKAYYCDTILKPDIPERKMAPQHHTKERKKLSRQTETYTEIFFALRRKTSMLSDISSALILKYIDSTSSDYTCLQYYKIKEWGRLANHKIGHHYPAKTEIYKKKFLNIMFSSR